MKYSLSSLLFLIIFTLSSSANAVSNNTWEDISDIGLYSLVGTALILPAARGDWEGFRQAGYSLGVAQGAALLGKALIHEDRPDHSNNDSFPSGHATVAFASATTLYRRYGWQTGLPAYAVATLTAYARVDARKHHWYDVVAGAAIGTASGWFFTDAFNDQVQLTPWLEGDAGGVNVSTSW